MRLHAVLAATFVLAGAARAEQDLPVPSPRSGEILRIPGLPPVELPPGAKVFGPNGPNLRGSEPIGPRPSARGEAPGLGAKNKDAAKKPDEAAPPKSAAEQRAQVLDTLFGQLAAAGDPEEAKAVSGAIERVWMHSGSDTADLLMGRAMAALGSGKTDASLDVLDRLVEVAPNWAEAWNKRATARFLRDDYDGSVADIDRVLRLEPRHFGALSGLATILQRSGDDKRALEVMRRVLKLNPQQPDLKKLIDRLVPEVEGRDI